MGRGKWTFFLLGLPAAGEWDLTADHPKLRFLDLPIESLGGSAGELPGQDLKKRLDVTLTVDHMPARPHSDERIVLVYCGKSERPRKTRQDSCSFTAIEQPLKAGLHDYRLQNLDYGRHYVSAFIDGEYLPGMGGGVGFYLSPTTEAPPVFPVVPLREMEVFGEISPGVAGYSGRAYVTEAGDDGVLHLMVQ